MESSSETGLMDQGISVEKWEELNRGENLFFVFFFGMFFSTPVIAFILLLMWLIP